MDIRVFWASDWGAAVDDLTRLPLEIGEDRHRVSVAELKIVLEPLDDLGGFHLGLELPVFQKSLFGGEFLEVFRRLTGFDLDVVEIGLEGHGIVD